MSVEHEVGALKARLDIMQKEIHQALSAVNQDLNSILGQVVGALQAFDARLIVLESKVSGPSSDKNSVGTPEEEPRSGKEL